MIQENQLHHQIQKLDGLKKTRQSREETIGELTGIIASAEQPLRRLRATNARESVRRSLDRFTQEINKVEPQVRATQVDLAKSYIKEDSLWQRNLAKVSSDERDVWDAEYQAFKERASRDRNVEEGLKILAEQKRAEEAAKVRVGTDPQVLGAPLGSDEAEKPLPASVEDNNLDLTKLGLGQKQLEIAEVIPQEIDQVIPRSELHHAFYPDKSSVLSRIDNNLVLIQSKLPDEYTIVNYKGDNKSPSLYGIRRRADYDGLLDETHTIPRVLEGERVEEKKTKGAAAATPAETVLVKPEDLTTVDQAAVATKSEPAVVAEEPLKLPDSVGLTSTQQEFASYFPLEDDLVVSRPEILHSEWPDADPLLRPDRFMKTVLRIQKKLVAAGYSIINFESDKNAPSLYGIRKLEDYEGALDMSSYTPRILPPLTETPSVSAVQPVEIQHKGIEASDSHKDELTKKEAKLLMEQIEESLKSGVSLDPEIMIVLQETYKGVMGEPVVEKDVQPIIEPKLSITRRAASELEDFLPELPTGQTVIVQPEADKVIQFEQREEDKIKPEERYLLGFVFGLLAEAKERDEQYINNDDFKARLKPRREFEQDGKTLVETYSTNDIIRLFGGALEKLIKESQQPLIQWDEDTRELFSSVAMYAADRGKKVDRIGWPLRIQLMAITRALDMGSRRVKEKE
jgi:hypothetical protein